MRLKLAAALLALPLAAAPAAAQPQDRPDLIVAIAVDQFSANLFNEYRRHFTGGLKRLAEGAVFPQGYQSHAATETCPGHSTILTGSRPARTGIIANNWFDLDAAREDKSVYCAEDESVAGSSSEDYTVSPAHLRVPTLGDRMKRADPRSRSVVVAGKDRAAIMLGGHHPDQRWYRGRESFVSDSGMAPTPAVEAANRSVAEALARPRPPLPLPPVCEARARAVAIEGGGRPVGDHRFQRGANEGRAFIASPEYDGAVLALAAALREEMALGQGPAPDLLAIGLSATDYVGHTYGTGGSEMCLQLMELDRSLGDFFAYLDRTGVDYAVVLTADHGGLDIPERARQQGIEGAVRADPALSVDAVGAAVAERLGIEGKTLWGEYVSGDMYVDLSFPPATRERIRAEAVAAYRAHPQVAAVFTREEIAATPRPTGDPQAWILIERARSSYDPERSGDFLVLLKPGVTPIYDTRYYTATHGSPWNYDRQVPILFWRAGLTAFEQPLGVETADILPTLAGLIGLPVPADEIDGRCLDLLSGPETSCPR